MEQLPGKQPEIKDVRHDGSNRNQKYHTTGDGVLQSYFALWADMNLRAYLHAASTTLRHRHPMDLPKKVVGMLQPISLCIWPSVFIFKHSFNPKRSFAADNLIGLGLCHRRDLSDSLCQVMSSTGNEILRA
jgi:hypothetical protein